MLKSDTITRQIHFKQGKERHSTKLVFSHVISSLDVCHFFRYSAHGRRAAEENVTWQRLRPALVETESRDLHVSDCLQGLRPGDHFEIQWRRTKEFPYGWWFGVVGHLQNCVGEENCRCISDGNIHELMFFLS